MALRKLFTTDLFSAKHFVRFGHRERILFAKRLSYLIRAGIPLSESLDLIRRQTNERGKKQMFDAILSDIENGQYLATSLSKFDRHFGSFTIHMIKIGETAGILGDNLLYLSEELTKRHTLRRKVQSALIYPAFISATTILVAGFLTLIIFPKIIPIFQSMSVELPLITRFLLGVSVILSEWGFVILFLIPAISAILVVSRRNIPWLRYKTDLLIIKLPIFGALSRNFNLAHIARTMSLLLRSGVRVTDALSIVAPATENRVYRAGLVQVKSKVEEGESLSKNIAKLPRLFPETFAYMVSIGEKTGSLSETLRNLSEMYETDLDEQTKNMSNAVEPLLLVIMGVVIGVIAISIILPLYDITRYMSR